MRQSEQMLTTARAKPRRARIKSSHSMAAVKGLRGSAHPNWMPAMCSSLLGCTDISTPCPRQIAHGSGSSHVLEALMQSRVHFHFHAMAGEVLHRGTLLSHVASLQWLPGIMEGSMTFTHDSLDYSKANAMWKTLPRWAASLGRSLAP